MPFAPVCLRGDSEYSHIPFKISDPIKSERSQAVDSTIPSFLLPINDSCFLRKSYFKFPILIILIESKVLKIPRPAAKDC